MTTKTISANTTDDDGRDVLEIAEHDALSKRVESALNATTSSDDLRALIQEVGTHRNRAEQRWITLKPGGAERMRVQTTGTLEALQNLARASELLRFAIDKADQQMAELARARESAMNREASENLPAMIERLNAAQSRREAAQAELVKAAADVRGLVGEVSQARSRAIRARLPAAGVEPRLINRFLESHVRDTNIARQSADAQRHAGETARSLGAHERQPEPSAA